MWQIHTCWWPGDNRNKLTLILCQTNVISISYGGQEADLPESYQTRQCAEFMKLGMQGVSIVLASGDSGTVFLSYIDLFLLSSAPGAESPRDDQRALRQTMDA
jgi:hypothetical protein